MSKDIENKGDDFMNKMRRKDREMDIVFAYSIIDKAEFGTLATLNEDGSPYCIPISIARQDNKIYIHFAYEANKIENIKRNPKLSMSFAGNLHNPNPITQEEFGKTMESPGTIGKMVSTKFTTEFESAVIFGTAKIVEDRNEKVLGMKLISEKYVPENMAYFDVAIDASLHRTCVIRIDIEKVTGKRKKYDKDGVEMKWSSME